MSCDLIIPARSGSKGVPLKNIKMLSGKPLIAHMIEAAQGCKNIDNIYVSTDGEEIARVAVEYGAIVIERPEEISGDVATSESAILHSLDILEEQGKLPENTCFGQCTSPLINSEDFYRAIQIMQSGKYDSIFSAKLFHGFIWNKDENGFMVGVNHDHTSRRLMRQEMQPQYQETGAFYIFNTQGFRINKNRFFGKIGICEIPEERSVDIDTLEDFDIASDYLERHQI